MPRCDREENESAFFVHIVLFGRLSQEKLYRRALRRRKPTEISLIWDLFAVFW